MQSASVRYTDKALIRSPANGTDIKWSSTMILSGYLKSYTAYRKLTVSGKSRTIYAHSYFYKYLYSDRSVCLNKK